MSLNEIIMRLIQYARTEIFPVIPESDRRVVTAVGITNALRLNQIRQQLEPVGNNIRVSDADIDTLVKYLRGESNMSWKDKLSMHLQDEENGHNAYMELANEAEKEGFCHEAGVLRDIAREEHTHHELLREMM